MKKNNVKKVFTNFVALILASVTMASLFTLAGAKHKVKTEPWVFMSTTEIDNAWNNLDYNTVYVEKAIYKICDKKGNDGYNLENPEYHACFKYDRYKGKKLKKGMKITCYFITDSTNEAHECLYRVDYYKGKKIHQSDIQP